jgi:hypothetical protein
MFYKLNLLASIIFEAKLSPEQLFILLMNHEITQNCLVSLISFEHNHQLS